MAEVNTISVPTRRTAIVQQLRRLLPGMEGARKGVQALPFGLAAIDSHLPDAGLPAGALHEIVPAAQAAFPAAIGFMAALLARLPRAFPIFLVLPAHSWRDHGWHAHSWRDHGWHASGRLYGHGFNSLGLDPARLVLVETAQRKETLWALAEALHSAAPGAVAGLIDRLDLKTSQKLQLAASDCGVPLFLIRPAQTLEASAAATRWRVGPAKAARDRFGRITQARWTVSLERCRNGRPGEWVVEYDHVAHRFSLAAALADPALSRRAGDQPWRQAG
jgi:protein ImuA